MAALAGRPAVVPTENGSAVVGKLRHQREDLILQEWLAAGDLHERAAMGQGQFAKVRRMIEPDA